MLFSFKHNISCLLNCSLPINFDPCKVLFLFFTQYQKLQPLYFVLYFLCCAIVVFFFYYSQYYNHPKHKFWDCLDCHGHLISIRLCYFSRDRCSLNKTLTFLSIWTLDGCHCFWWSCLAIWKVLSIFHRKPVYLLPLISWTEGWNLMMACQHEWRNQEAYRTKDLFTVQDGFVAMVPDWGTGQEAGFSDRELMWACVRLPVWGVEDRLI